jgi:hypothetical protein
MKGLCLQGKLRQGLGLHRTWAGLMGLMGEWWLQGLWLCWEATDRARVAEAGLCGFLQNPDLPPLGLCCLRQMVEAGI